MTGVLQEAWAAYRAHARHLLTIAFVIYVVAALAELLLVGVLDWFGAILALVIGVIAAFLLQAALVTAVNDIRDGRVDLSFGDTLRAAQPFIGRVAIASILAGIAIAIGFVLLIAPGLYLLTIWCVLVPVIVLENVSIGAAFDRSRRLVRGYGWPVFGTLVLVFLLLIAANLVITLVLAALPRDVENFIASLVSGTLVAPYLALVITLGYFRLLAARSAPGGPPPV
jgi:hypothetical protein